MPVEKFRDDNGFFQIPNDIFNLGLSPDAFMLYCYAQSMGEEWIFHQEPILNALGWYPKKLRKARDELIKAGLASGQMAKGGGWKDNNLTFYAVPKDQILPIRKDQILPIRKDQILPIRKDQILPPNNKKKTIKINNIPPYPQNGGMGEEDVRQNDFSNIIEIIKIWQEVFPEGSRSIIGNPEDILSTLSRSFQANVKEAFRQGFKIPDFRKAFETLKEDISKSWQLHSAVKTKNLRLLLTQAENQLKQPLQRIGRGAPVLTREDFLNGGW